MRGSIGDIARIKHILECVEEIENAIAGYDFEQFSENHVLRIAVVKWLEIIGEAANHISENVKSKYPTIEWRKINGLRNLVIHEYFKIDFRIIWDAATVFVPKLKKDIQSIKPE